MTFVDIVYIGDTRYADAIKVSAESALRRAKNPGSIRIHVVTNDKDFPDIGYDVRYWDRSDSRLWHGTDLVWSRIDFADLFPECDWVISCDGDTLWLDSPEELFSLRDDNLILLGSRDCASNDAHPVNYYPWWKEHNLNLPMDKSYCCGLMLMNLEKMRKSGFVEKCKDFVVKYPAPPQCEQTVMCYLAKDSSGSLPAEWGVFSFWHTSVDKPKLIHYAVDLPWRRDKINRLISDVVLLWWIECERVFEGEKKWPGYRGCANRFDYLWRRILYVVMRPLSGCVAKIGWLNPHFRNARGFCREEWQELTKKNVVLLTHPAPYRDFVLGKIKAVEGTAFDVKSIFRRDFGHASMNLGDDGLAITADVNTLYPGLMSGIKIAIKLIGLFCLSRRYRFVIWPAYAPWWLTLPVVVRALLGRRFAVSLDTVRDSSGTISRWLKSFIFNKADFLWVPGQASLCYLMQQYGIDKSKIVKGLYLPDFPCDFKCNSKRKNDDNLRFLMVANNLPVRRMDVVVGGFKKFLCKHNNVRLVLCGRETASFSGEGVDVIDGVKSAELPNLYAKADVYVHNGSEQFSTALLLGAMAGLPLISGRGVGACADLFDEAKSDGDPGVMVDSWESEEEWAHAFEEMYSKREKWIEMGTCAKKRANCFDPEFIAKTIVENVRQ